MVLFIAGELLLNDDLGRFLRISAQDLQKINSLCIAGKIKDFSVPVTGIEQSLLVLDVTVNIKNPDYRLI